MMDAIERARAERRLAVKLAAVLLVIVAVLFGLLIWVTGPPPAPPVHTPIVAEPAE
jgi:hypothetical protein